MSRALFTKRTTHNPASVASRIVVCRRDNSPPAKNSGAPRDQRSAASQIAPATAARINHFSHASRTDWKTVSLPNIGLPGPGSRGVLAKTVGRHAEPAHDVSHD